MNRRTALGLLASAPVIVACRESSAHGTSSSVIEPLVPDPVLSAEPLGNPPWPTRDPFLFCVHHYDAYPAGNGQFGPKASLAGRRLGQDFAPHQDWRMYHGQAVPGFPSHPHRGFETVTVVRRGLVDHADSLGAAARYGAGDVQWLTAGGGIVHAEMFPLLDESGPNPLELFQIWLNLPSTDKMVAPHFSMLWSHSIPRQTLLDAQGRATHVEVIAGSLGAQRAPSPPPKSYASRKDSDVAIWTLRMAPSAQFSLPAAKPDTRRMLYFYRGDTLKVGATSYRVGQALELRANLEVPLANGSQETELLLLQGRPIEEPVVQYGPFVMNTPAEIQKAFADYRATGFGGWPWPDDAPVHAREERFARHADGRIERGS